MNEVGSFIGLAALTKSEITIKNVSYQNLGIIPKAFRRLGIQFDVVNDDIYVPYVCNCCKIPKMGLLKK